MDTTVIDQFRILGVCEVCDRTDWLNREKLADDMAIDSLRDLLICQHCGRRGCAIRIVYVGGGGFEYG